MKDPAVATHTRRISALAVSLLLMLGCPFAAVSQTKESALWNAIKSGGYVVLMRHADAPGTGDPAGFKPGICSTQRNLSDDGRRQAERIGDRFRANGVAAATVYSSPWCRCIDTATALKLGPVTESGMVASTYQNSPANNPAEDSKAVAQWLAKLRSDKPVVVVTHQVNITALTDVFPSSGEMVVVNVGAKGELKVIGSIRIE